MRLGKNIGGYKGEVIDLQKVLQDIEIVMTEKNWARDRIALFSDPSSQQADFLGCRRDVPSARKRVYISTGIHGDEPAGPLAVLQMLQEDQWPADCSIWLCPCLNPTGFRLNRRENFQGIDLNRDYRHLQSQEIRTHVEWLNLQPGFDLALCLHEDWEAQGFYMYELNPDNRDSPAKRMIDAVSVVCPIDKGAVIENWPAENGIIRPKVNPLDRPQWPESIYLISCKARLSYTLEAPSDFPLATRVAALVTAVEEALEAL